MRFAFLIFGATGFMIMAVAGFAADRPFDLVLRDSAVGCLLTALVGRWFWGVLDRAFAETVRMRREAAEVAEAAEAAEAAQSKPPAAAGKPTPPRPAPAQANR
jgi:hypothetical protein